jgi:hypothetical protein
MVTDALPSVALVATLWGHGACGQVPERPPLVAPSEAGVCMWVYHGPCACGCMLVCLLRAAAMHCCALLLFITRRRGALLQRLQQGWTFLVRCVLSLSPPAPLSSPNTHAHMHMISFSLHPLSYPPPQASLSYLLCPTPSPYRLLLILPSSCVLRAPFLHLHPPPPGRSLEERRRSPWASALRQGQGPPKA